MAAGAEKQDGHADGDAVGHLFEDDAAGTVRQFAVDFDSAIDGTGVHDDRLWVEPAGAGFIESEHARVFAE